MPPKKKNPPTRATSPASSKNGTDLPPLAGYLISCDIPTKQYILYLNELKPVDKKFVLEDLDATHVLVKKRAKDEIERKVEAWMDENVFSGKRLIGVPVWQQPRIRFDSVLSVNHHAGLDLILLAVERVGEDLNVA